MDALEVLQTARGFLSEPARWHKGDFVNRHWIDANMPEPEHARHDDAVKAGCPACILGALAVASSHLDCNGRVAGTFNGRPPVLQKAIDLIERGIDQIVDEDDDRTGDDIPEFNDNKSTTHAEILSVFDAAIRLATKEGPTP